MAEEKKPKIDLKARLGKGAGGATPPPPVAGIPVPAVPSCRGQCRCGQAAVPQSRRVEPGRRRWTPGASGHSGRAAARVREDAARRDRPVEPARRGGDAVPRARACRSGAAAAAAADRGRRDGRAGGPQGRPQAGPHRRSRRRRRPRRHRLHRRRRASRRTRAVRSRSATRSRSPATSPSRAISSRSIADKVEAGSNSLLKEKKFPDTLAKELGGINVDFDGNKLAGVRFSGFPQETTSTLIEYITSVQTLNDRKTAIIGLLQRLQKPITEQLTAGQKTTHQLRRPLRKAGPVAQPVRAARAAPEADRGREPDGDRPAGGVHRDRPAHAPEHHGAEVHDGRPRQAVGRLRPPEVDRGRVPERDRGVDRPAR